MRVCVCVFLKKKKTSFNAHTMQIRLIILPNPLWLLTAYQ